MATLTETEAHITHVEGEFPFIKIFAQTDKEYSLLIEKLMYQLRGYFEKLSELKPKSQKEIYVGLICCAKFEDGLYYRARLENTDNMHEFKVKALFMDHGNTADLKITDIRLISKLNLGQSDKKVKDLLEMPPLANDYYLIGVASKDKEWDVSTIQLVKTKICNSNVVCGVCKVEGKRFIKFPENCDPANLLISLDKAYPVTLGTQERFVKQFSESKSLLKLSLPDQFNVPPPSVVMKQPPPTRLPNITQPPPIRMMTDVNSLSGTNTSQLALNRLGSNMPIRHGIPGMAMRRPEMQIATPPVQQSLQFSTEMLAPGGTHIVVVSHVEDGPYSFAVQLRKTVDDILAPLMADINSSEPQPITGPLNPGAICLGRHTDGSLCRAIVMNVLDDKVKVYFADFGSSQLLPYSDIYQIPPKFVMPKVMSHRFTLANIKDVKYTEEQKRLFGQIVGDCFPITMLVTPPEANPLKQYCELHRNHKNVKVIIQEMSRYLRFSSLSTPIVGSQEKVFVPFVLNPGRFFVQLDKNSYSLNQIMNCVATHCRNAAHIPLVNLKAGEPCCALYEDGKWYRAEILKVNQDNKAFINFVDFGNQEEIELSKLRQITPELVGSVKAQALVCCLQGYELRYDVDENISNLLEELILEKVLMMHVIGCTENNVLIVQLLDQTGQDIGAQLEVKPSQSPVYNSYQASTSAPSVPPSHSRPGPTASANNEWEETPQASQERYSDTRGPSDEGKKAWRSRDDESAPRYNKEGDHRTDGAKPERRFNKDDEEKPWKKGESRFNTDDNRGGGGRFNRDDNNRFGERGSRFNDDDKGGRFNRDSDSRGGRFNKTDDEKPWRKRDDDSGGWRGNKDREEGGSWKDRESSGGWNKEGSGGGWRGNKDREDGGSWKDRESSGSWNKDKEGHGGGWKDKDAGGGDGWRDGGGDRKSRFDNDGGGYKKGGFSRDTAGERSSFRKPWEKGGGDSFGKTATKSPKPDTVGGMPPASVKVGTTEDTQVVYTNSPIEFYIQLTKSFEELNQLMEKIATACESGEASDMSFVQDKSGCLAKYSEDETWYRGYIEEKTFDSAKVLFVDYGNQENVQLDKLKTLPEDMCTLPVQAVKCRLYGVPETAEVDAFSALVDGKTLKTQFVSKHFLTKSFQVVMVDEESGSNINTAMGAAEEEVQSALSKLGQTTRTPAQYAAGTSLTAQMTWYLSPSIFYLQSMASNPEFRAMMQSMQSLVRTGSVKQNNQLNIGDFVVARFKTDKVLYRALVKESGFAPTVQYVDYGNTEAVDSGNVWAMEPEYATLPSQAFECCLAGVKPTGDDWPTADTTDLDVQFEAETLECSIVTEMEGDPPSFLVRLVKEGEDLAQKIIEAGFAVASSDAVEVTELDTSLLVGQRLPVTVLRIEDNYTFFVQSAEEDVELKSLEGAAGEGIKCSLSSVREDSTEEQQAQFKQLPSNTCATVLVDAVQTDGLQVTLYDAEGQLLPLQASEVSSVDKICPLPVLNTYQRVWIAHASPDGIFLHKIVFADFLSDLLQKLYDFYNETEPVEQEWTEGQLACAKSANDEQWYRARILEAGAETKVQYLDYGNSEVVPVANLRKLDPSFYTPHAFALKVNLHVTWNVPVENLLELAGETEYNAVVLRNNQGWVVELVDNSGKSLTDRLIELGFATALENSPFQRVVEGGRFVEGSNIPVSVSFIDSPLQLWIFVGNDIELIEALQDRLQEAAPKLPSLTDPKSIFAAKFSDGLWYRAVKLDDSKVRFIDYGNSDVVDMSDIKELSADFLEPVEGYAVKVELPVVNFKEEATERLEELLISPEINSEEEIVAHILSVKESSIVADILKGGKSVVDTLVEENLSTRSQQVSSGFVSNINSPSDFFIQEVGCEEILETVANIMLTAENFEPLSQTTEGDIVAALYAEDGVWYRAKITKKSEDITEVLFVDYGNSADATELRALPSDLAAKPHLSKHCALQLPSGVAEWSEAANQKFIEMSADGCTQFDFTVLNEEDPAIVILSCDGKCVTEELKLLCNVVEKGITESESVPIDLTGYDKTVFISHVNSPTNFYVQSEGAELELDAIKEEFVDTSAFEILEEITDEAKEKIIGALFDDDELWYRAKVLNTLEEGAEVLFVDYGNSAISTKFVKLPEAMESKAPLAVHCALRKTDWPEEAISYFRELSGEGSVPFLMKVLEEDDPNIVSLICGERVVERELSVLFEQPENDNSTEQKRNPLSITVGTEPVPIESETTAVENETSSTNVVDEGLIKSVYLIHVNSPSDFFVHTAEATQLVEKISEELTAAGDFPFVEESTVSKGSIVAAQFDEDDLWYRAKILDHSEIETKVLFVDYGNTAKVAKMKNLPEDLLLTPPLAIHSSLQAKGVNEWSLKACETFNKLANDDGVSFDLKIVSEGDPNVVILYINGESVAEQLILVSGLITGENNTPETEQDEILNLNDEAELKSVLASPTKSSNSAVEQENDEVVGSEEYFEDPVTDSDKESSLTEPQTQQSTPDMSESDPKPKVVEISHFNNAGDFFIQFSDYQEELMKMTEEMSQWESFETMLDAEEILAAKYTCDDLWYRAKILDANSMGSTVLFIDHGNTDTTNEFRKLPKHLAEKKPLAKRCCLKTLKGVWTESTNNKLSALAKIGGFTFDMKVLEEGDPCVIDLIVNGRSLTKTFLEQEITEENSEIGEMILQSVEKQISNNTNKDMEQIINNVILNNTSSKSEEECPTDQDITVQPSDESKPDEHIISPDISDNTNKDMEQVINNVILNAVSSKSDEECHTAQDITVKPCDESKPDEPKIRPEFEDNSPNEKTETNAISSQNECPTAQDITVQPSDEHIIGYEIEDNSPNEKTETNAISLQNECPTAQDITVQPSDESKPDEQIMRSEFEDNSPNEKTETNAISIQNECPTAQNITVQPSDESKLDEQIMRSEFEDNSPNEKTETNAISIQNECPTAQNITVQPSDESKLDEHIIRSEIENNSPNEKTETNAISIQNECPTVQDITVQPSDESKPDEQIMRSEFEDNSPNEKTETIAKSSQNQFNTSNGVHDEDSEEVHGFKIKNDNTKQEESSNNTHKNISSVSLQIENSLKNVCSGSPPAPRRSNIDDHIVPGCISSMKLDESSERS